MNFSFNEKVGRPDEERRFSSGDPLAREKWKRIAENIMKSYFDLTEGILVC